jgi:hypothetical protein
MLSREPLVFCVSGAVEVPADGGRLSYVCVMFDRCFAGSYTCGWPLPDRLVVAGERSVEQDEQDVGRDGTPSPSVAELGPNRK